MRNTDRGSDNYMIKSCEATHEKPLIDVAPSAAQQPRMPSIDERAQMRVPTPESASYFPQQSPPINLEDSSYTRRPHMHIAAIDNSLSFPHEHPKGWRSYTYGVCCDFPCA
jgi:phosphatidylinositol 4-kinase type 2